MPERLFCHFLSVYNVDIPRNVYIRVSDNHIIHHQFFTTMEEKIMLRDKLVDIALQWQASFGVAPSITSSISEYDDNAP